MATDIGHGCVLKRSGDGTSGGTMTTVGVVYDFTPPAMARDMVESTNHGSTGRHREYVGGLKDAGELTADIEFDPGDANWLAFVAEYDADTAGYYQIVFNDDGSTTWGFSGYVREITPVAPIDDKRMATVVIKITGYPAWIAAA